MNIIFMGTPAFSLPTLERLLASSHTVKAVITQPDRPVGRGKKIQSPLIKKSALAHNLPILQPVKINTDAQCKAILREMNPDIIVVIAYGQIISEEILQIPRYGCINIHASLLPRYRGAAPINWAIINGEKKTGITIMKMDKGMDTGNILSKREIEILPSDTAITLYDKLAGIGAEALSESLDMIEKGTVVEQEQEHHLATYAPRLKKEDGLINWQNYAQTISNKIRGLVSWPGGYTKINEKILKIWRAEVLPPHMRDEAFAPPGTITVHNKSEIRVSTGSGIINILELQMQDKKKMKAKEFIQGNILKSGDILG